MAQILTPVVDGVGCSDSILSTVSKVSTLIEVWTPSEVDEAQIAKLPAKSGRGRNRKFALSRHSWIWLKEIEMQCN